MDYTEDIEGVYLLQLSLSQFFIEIDIYNKVKLSDSVLLAQLFDNIYTANSFKNLLSKHYNKEFTVIKI